MLAALCPLFDRGVLDQELVQSQRHHLMQPWTYFWGEDPFLGHSSMVCPTVAHFKCAFCSNLRELETCESAHSSDYRFRPVPTETIGLCKHTVCTI